MVDMSGLYKHAEIKNKEEKPKKKSNEIGLTIGTPSTTKTGDHPELCITEADLRLIDSKIADKFATYVKSLDRETHINPLVKRITYKDGKTRIGVVYEFIQLWNEFIEKN